MADPNVWADAKARATAAAATLGLPVSLPNEQVPDLTAMYVRLEIQSSGSAPIELTGGVWQEDGTFWMHVLVPTGAGFDAGNLARHQLGLAFRGAQPIEGLTYTEILEAPEDTGDDAGNWCLLSAGVSYRFQSVAATN